MLGYITEKEAFELGFTHHGKYYGIPIWCAPENDMMVATKFFPFEYLMTAFCYIEGFLHAAFLPDQEPYFMFLVTDEIKPNKGESNA